MMLEVVGGTNRLHPRFGVEKSTSRGTRLRVSVVARSVLGNIQLERAAQTSEAMGECGSGQGRQSRLKVQVQVRLQLP